MPGRLLLSLPSWHVPPLSSQPHRRLIPSSFAVSNQKRCAKLGDLLAAASTRSASDKSSDATDKLAAEKMRSSAVFKAFVTSLEALVSDAPDYKAVIKCMAPSAVGRIYLTGGAAASPVMSKFAAARNAAELDEALNVLLAVDEAGSALGKTVVSKGMTLKVRRPRKPTWPPHTIMLLA